MTLIVSFGCNNTETSDLQTAATVSQEQLDTIESLLTADDFFWQSENSGVCSAEVLFRKDGTATALGHEYSTYVNGNWTFDKSANKLQIAWENLEQVLTAVIFGNDEGLEISFTNHI